MLHVNSRKTSTLLKVFLRHVCDVCSQAELRPGMSGRELVRLEAVSVTLSELDYALDIIHRFSSVGNADL